MDFINFCKQEDPVKNETDKKIKEQQFKPQNKDIMNEYNKYKDYNEQDLFNELVKKIKVENKDSSFDGEKIKNQLAPFLTREQKENLQQILDRLGNE